MHLRRATVRSKGRTYRYSQLVESFRRPDGVPASRVVFSFGALSDLEHENLRRAFHASAGGKAVVLASDAPPAVLPILDNLGYLAHAVLLELWKGWGLPDLIDGLACEDAREVRVSDVIAALVLQRSIRPDSKLASVDWYERTALPELQGCSVTAYNNTRIHRALDALFRIEAPLQEALVSKVVARQGRPQLLFLDCTDTWFTSDGPPLASKRIGKDQTLRMQIGILLLCDQDGLPLRWATLPGWHHEGDSMLKIVQAVSRWQWAREAPLVMDRAGGTHTMVTQLRITGIRFLTAVPASEFASYSDRIPRGSFDSVERDADALRRHALELGFVRVSDERYLLDLGVFSRGERASGPEEHTLLPTCSRAVASLLFARKLASDFAAHDTYPSLAARYGIAARSLQRFANLLGLQDSVQQAVLDGHADRLSVDQLRSIAVLPADEQLRALLDAEQASTGKPILLPTRATLAHIDADVLQVRGVVVFNPQRFLNQKVISEDRQKKLATFTTDLNARLSSPSSKRDRDSVLAEVAEYLRRHALTSMYDLKVAETEHHHRKIWQVELTRDEAESANRRASDGLSLIIAHPELTGTAANLVESYFAKDKVEKDFRIIKSSLHLRPVHHRTDPKVQAHVSLCVLALLLQRTLEQRIRAAGLDSTAERALAALDSCHLNRLASEIPAYCPTVPTREQRLLVDALGLPHLLDETAISSAITPR